MANTHGMSVIQCSGIQWKSATKDGKVSMANWRDQIYHNNKTDLYRTQPTLEVSIKLSWHALVSSVFPPKTAWNCCSKSLLSQLLYQAKPKTCISVLYH